MRKLELSYRQLVIFFLNKHIWITFVLELFPYVFLFIFDNPPINFCQQFLQKLTIIRKFIYYDIMIKNIILDLSRIFKVFGLTKLIFLLKWAWLIRVFTIMIIWWLVLTWLIGIFGVIITLLLFLLGLSWRVDTAVVHQDSLLIIRSEGILTDLNQWQYFVP